MGITVADANIIVNRIITSEESPSALVKDTGIIFVPERHRVIALPYNPFQWVKDERIMSRVLALDESDVHKEFNCALDKFSHRHHNFEAVMERRFDSLCRFMPTDVLPSRERRCLIGSFFLSEYSFESAALFNPSIVPNPDQSGLPPGSLRFIMSLRATGEGHISSIKFRSGCIDEDYNISWMTHLVLPAPQKWMSIPFTTSMFWSKTQRNRSVLRSLEIHHQFATGWIHSYRTYENYQNPDQ